MTQNQTSAVAHQFTMIVLVLCLAFLGASHGTPQGRIIGGTAATKGDYPWGVSLQILKWGSWTHAYGGIWLGDNRVLTAAHGVDGLSLSSMRVVLGEHRLSQAEGSEQTLGVSSIFVHPAYDSNAPGYPNDLAILHLSSAPTENTWIQPVSLATTSMNFTGAQCAISGWGRTTATGGASDILQHANVTLISNADCSSRWSGVPGTAILSSHICTFDVTKSACSGDSGGPLVCKQFGFDYLAGVTSWGTSSCTGMPTVFVRVAGFLGWIGST